MGKEERKMGEEEVWEWKEGYWVVDELVLKHRGCSQMWDVVG